VNQSQLIAGEVGDPGMNDMDEVPGRPEEAVAFQEENWHNTRSIVFQVDRRAMYGILALIGTVSLFCIGLVLGLALTGVAPWQPVASLARQPIGFPGAQAAQPNTSGSAATQGQQPPWVKPNADSQQLRAVAPVKSHEPDGDHPHVEFPDIASAGNVFDLGEFASDSMGTEKTMTLRNSGNQPLVIEDVGAT